MPLEVLTDDQLESRLVEILQTWPLYRTLSGALPTYA